MYSESMAAAAAAKLLQLCLTLCDPIDGSPPGSAVPGILQARTLDWVAIGEPMSVTFKYFGILLVELFPLHSYLYILKGSMNMQNPFFNIYHYIHLSVYFSEREIVYPFSLISFKF